MLFRSTAFSPHIPFLVGKAKTLIDMLKQKSYISLYLIVFKAANHGNSNLVYEWIFTCIFVFSVLMLQNG